MSNKSHYRQIKGVIKTCKKCGQHWRPPVYSSALQGINLCDTCRKPFYRKFYREYWKPYLVSLTPEKREKLKGQVKKAWISWVKKNPDERREQALASYHRNKENPKNMARKHRATNKV